MSSGELLTRITIWAALVGYAVGAALLLMSRQGRDRLSAARWWWTAGCALFLVHVVCAFHFYHDWSHARAYEETARQVGETMGMRSGNGIFVSYAFTLLWLFDVVWWWMKGAQSYRQRPKWLMAMWQGFFFFIVFNGTVVFESGLVRWFGVLLCSALVAMWLVRQQALSKGRATEKG